MHGLSAAPSLGLRSADADACFGEAQRVARNAISAMAEGLSPQAERIIGKVVGKLAAHPDYASTEARPAVDAVLWNLVRFLDYRMDMTRGHDATGSYLFADTERAVVLSPASATRASKVGVAKSSPPSKSSDRRDHFERDLQLDCMHMIQPTLGRTARLEASDIAAGRADILVEIYRTRLVIEVKHEDADASHDALLRRYGSQATEYSNTSARIGFLLVLDRSRADGSAGHIEDKVVVRKVRKVGDSEDRMLVIIVMPGRRKRPSALT